MTKRMVHFCLLVGSMLVAMLCTEASAFAQVTATASSAPASVPPVANPCPRLAPGSVVHQPAALFSLNGVLSVQFSYQTTTDAAGRNLFCFMTPSGLENPTLHVNPGDNLIITVTNNTPKMPVEMVINPPNYRCDASPSSRTRTASSGNSRGF